MHTSEQIILRAIEALRARVQRPIVVALDGGSGAGKTTIARSLACLTHVATIPLDDFYQTVIPESAWALATVEQRLSMVFDWHRVRIEALQPLRGGRPGRWRAFDFARGLDTTGKYSLKSDVTEVAPAPTILLEGAYSASPVLRDLIDVSVLVDVQSSTRHFRVAARERDSSKALTDWHAIWDEAEAHYLQRVCPPESFDLVIQNLEGAG
jgi:para-aminobenzoate synthetase